MNTDEKIAVYREALEGILIIGHSLQSTDNVNNALTVIINSVWEALKKAGDINTD